MRLCSPNCKHLIKDYGICARPELLGKGVMLKRTNCGFVSDCRHTYKKCSEEDVSIKYCSKKCAFLDADYGVCIRPELKGKGVVLRVDNGKYIKECNQFDKTEEKKKNNKYNARKITVDGVVYDSLLEYSRFCELRLQEMAGQISELKYHVPFILIEKSEKGREIKYEADFVYKKDGKLIVEDVKSGPTKTRLYKLKKRLMLEKYGIKIQEFEKGELK